MKLKFIMPVVFIPIIGLTSCNLSFSTEGKIEFFSQYYIADGDTIYLDYNNQKTGLRFLGIDTPETKKAKNDVALLENIFAQKARQELKKLLNNKPIKVQIISTDKYKRIVARIWNYQNIDVNVFLLKNGLARVKYLDKNRNNINYWNNNWKIQQYYDTLISIEAKARLNKIGIWKYKQDDIFYKK
ncbi:hypothetical protein EG856_00305 [Mycoplasmopsis phocirhinis]|uniref:TNase-like domain-containing protein n=1 Tax=Mycoplasmopsis phocirhinis TaxID=142650 RepID=A0A4P6MNC2_9BACT|nr:thermonuclease family protein [Mycoplasmopsis phocirhinis]QBF34380.1 hypothetical protein EG856_00305 [Mycoplasmopsis phocirhinis]